MERWGIDKDEQVTDLLGRCLPGDELTSDDVHASLWDDPDPHVVIGRVGGEHEGGAGAVAAAVLRPADDAPVAHLQVIAVDAALRRQGIGRELLADLSAWAVDAGASVMVAGAAAPFYLWPGVDFALTPALCFFEAAGFVERRPSFNMRFPDAFRVDPPLGIEVRRVLEDGEAGAVMAFSAAHHPNWVPELTRGIEHGTAFAAWDDTEVVGFACHSVNRLGWVGPMATHPERRSAGVGGGLLSALTNDLRPLGRGFVEVAWVGPAGFYAKAAGAEVSRVFRTLTRRLA